jgi:hypothetical protein
VTHPFDATTEMPPVRGSRAEDWRAIQVAPGPEIPDTPNRDGRRRGLILAVTGGLAFWAVVGALVVYMINR